MKMQHAQLNRIGNAQITKSAAIVLSHNMNIQACCAYWWTGTYLMCLLATISSPMWVATCRSTCTRSEECLKVKNKRDSITRKAHSRAFVNFWKPSQPPPPPNTFQSLYFHTCVLFLPKNPCTIVSVKYIPVMHQICSLWNWSIGKKQHVLHRLLLRLM